MRWTICLVGILLGFFASSAVASGWYDSFDSYTSGQLLPWESTSQMWATASIGYNSTNAAKGPSDGWTYGSAWKAAPNDDTLEVTARLYVSSTPGWPGVLLGFTPDKSVNGSGNFQSNDCVSLLMYAETGDPNPRLMLVSSDWNDSGYDERIVVTGLAYNTWYDVKLRIEKRAVGVYEATAWWKPSAQAAWRRVMDWNRDHVTGYDDFAPNYVAISADRNGYVDDVRALPGNENFDGYASGQLLPWEDTASMYATSGIGYNSSVGVEGPTSGWTFGRAWRQVEPVDGILEVTAKLYASSTESWPVARVGVTPDKSIAADGSFGGNDSVILFIYSETGDPNPRLMLVSTDVSSGQDERIIVTGLAYNTWYDVKLRIERRPDNTYEATAWRKPSGEAVWQQIVDSNRDHVVCYDDFAPNYAAISAYHRGYVDDVQVGPLTPLPALTKKVATILTYSHTSPDTKYMHDNIASMEMRPLDGVSTWVAYPRQPNGSVYSGTDRGNLDWWVFQKTLLTLGQVQPAITDLQTTPIAKFYHNYLLMTSYYSGPMNWFDDAWWTKITANAKLLAKVAKDGGCEGIMFDPEEYGGAIWGWPTLSQNAPYQSKTYAQVSDKVRQRGREFITAINQAYPGVHVWTLCGWSLPIVYIRDEIARSPIEPLPAVGDKAWLPLVRYGLLVPFLDGILEASDAETVVIDGTESGYYVESITDFLDKARWVKQEGVKLSDVPDQFNAKVRTGFGIWLDRDSHWDPVNTNNNRWTPTTLTKVLTNALFASDGYVWFWSERATWWLASATDQLGGGIQLGDPYGDTWRNENIKWIPTTYWSAVEQARQNAALPSFAISGRITLQDFTGDLMRVPITVELRRHGGGTTCKTVYLGSDGRVTLSNIESGTYDVAFKASHWLQEVVYNLQVGP